jgi:Protein of unknown function (DUF2510)
VGVGLELGRLSDGGQAPPAGTPSGGWQQPQPWAQPGAQAPPAAPWQHAQQRPQPAVDRQPRRPGGLLLRTGFFPLAFLLHFFPPKASIDGGPPFDLRWGDNPLPGVPVGRHHVRVWFRYLFFGDCGVADGVIDVPPQGTFLEYRAPTWFVFSRGRFPALEQQQRASAAGAGPGGGAWHPDPTGRAEQRYWDGQAWTGHVVRGGQQGWDPV